jgi:hypothetical protein
VNPVPEVRCSEWEQEILLPLPLLKEIKSESSAIVPGNNNNNKCDNAHLLSAKERNHT